MQPIVFLCALCAFAAKSFSADPPSRFESFDQDPKWESQNNRPTADVVTPTITQDFGYTKTRFAAKTEGEIGGQLWRSTTPAWYARKLDKPITLDDRFSASGTFCITESTANSGVVMAFFNSDQPGYSRPIQSLFFDFDGERTGMRLALRLVTASNQSCGTFITPFIPGKYRPTPIKNDGTRYHFNLQYDPAAAEGKGQFSATVKADSDTHEEFESKTFNVTLPAEFRKEKCIFDRFGLMNLQRPGNPLKFYLGDLQLNGQAVDLSRDPQWEGVRNHLTFQDRETSITQDFGFSPTNFAGGAKAGEVGGIFWRIDKGFACYADKVGPLTLDQSLQIKGKVILPVGPPDSAMYIGFFNSRADPKGPCPADDGNFLGILVEGPTRIGHYFRPCYTTAQRAKAFADPGIILAPRKPHDFSLTYDPTASNGNGAIHLTLDTESLTFNLKPGHKAQGATFDRFGLFTANPSGGLVKIFFDDLTYSK